MNTNSVVDLNRFSQGRLRWTCGANASEKHRGIESGSSDAFTLRERFNNSDKPLASS